jgi:hypothetical protein
MYVQPGSIIKIPDIALYIISILTGLTWKLYDDFTDIGIASDNSLPMEFLKIAIILTTTLMLTSNIYLAIIFALLTAGVLAEGVAESVFWKAGSICPIIALALTATTFTYNSIGELAFFVFNLISCIGILFAEHVLFPEEMSWKKAAARLINAPLMFIFPYLFPYYAYSPALLLIAFWNLGYTVGWAGLHAYLYFKNKDTAVPAADGESSVVVADVTSTTASTLNVG